MTATRQDKLKHLLTTILGGSDNDDVHRWVEKMGIKTHIQLNHVIFTDPSALEQLIPDHNGNGNTVLPKATRFTLGSLADFVVTETGKGTDVMALTPENFDQFQEEQLRSQQQAVIDAAAAAAAPKRTPSPIKSKPDDLHYSKRDIESYQSISQRHAYYAWIKNVETTAKIQGIIHPFDPAYIPVTTHERQQFEIDNAFVYKIALNTVKYSSGKQIVEKYEDSFDGQAVFSALANDAESDIVRNQNKKILERKLRNLDANPEIWKKSLEFFLDTWLRKKKEYERAAGSDMNEDKAWEMLEASLLGHPVARQAISQARMLQRTAAAMSSSSVIWKLDNWIHHLRECFQEEDESWKEVNRTDSRSSKKGKQKGKKNKSSKDNQNIETNKSEQEDKARHERIKKYHEQLKSVGMHVPSETWRSWSDEQKQEHKKKAQEKIRALSSTAQTNNNASQAASNKTNQNGIPTLTPVDAPAATHIPGAGSMAQALSNSNTKREQIIKIGDQFYRINKSIYHVSKNDHDEEETYGALLDSGSNGGLAGKNCLILNEDPVRKVDITGIENNSMTNIPIVQAAEKVHTNNGPVILVMNQYAGIGKGQTIHSTIQLRDFGVMIDDVPTSQKHIDGSRGTQSVKLLHQGREFVMPLHFHRGLAYFPESTKPTWDEMESDQIPKIHITKPDWDPERYTDGAETPSRDTFTSYLQQYTDQLAQFTNHLSDTVTDTFSSLFSFDSDNESEDDERTIPSDNTTFHPISNLTSATLRTHEAAQKHTSCEWLKRHQQDVEDLRPNFAFLPMDRIKSTLKCTTQFYHQHRWGNRMKRHQKTRFPGANVRRTNETVTTDFIYWDGPPAHDDGILGHGGATGIQFFAGKDTAHLAGYPAKTDKDFVPSLREYIRKIGAPEKLWSDGSRAVTNSKEALEIYRLYNIDNGFSEAGYQNQNKAERRHQAVQSVVISLMNATGTPPAMWLLCYEYVMDLLNHTAVASIGERTPYEKKFGETPDISKFLHYHWWEPVYFLDLDGSEKLGRWCGNATHVGDELTFAILSGESGKLLYRSDIRTATDPKRPNLRAEAILQPSSGEGIGISDNTEDEAAKAHPVAFDAGEDISESCKLPTYTPKELIGMHFLKKDEESDTLVRHKVVRQLETSRLNKEKTLRFIVQTDTSEPGQKSVEEIMDYNELCELVEAQIAAASGDRSDELFTFDKILAHEGPLSPTDPSWNGSRWNVQIAWDNGDVTWEPRDIIHKGDPISLAMYAKENNLLKTPGWKRYKRTVRQMKKATFHLRRMLKNNRKRTSGPQFCYGVRLPDWSKPYQDLDAENGNHLWQEAVDYEIACYDENDVFEDRGPATEEAVKKLLAEGYQKIRLVWSYAVKHDGRRRARLCAGGHTTFVDDTDCCYSSVVSLRSLRMVLLLGLLNGLMICTADIVSAYLQAYTQEKIFFIAGKEFGDRAGHLMMMKKACYGLRTSGKRYHDLIYDVMGELGFKPSLADPDIYIRDAGDCYEYVAVYVDDLTCVMKDPHTFLDQIRARHLALKDVTDSPDVFLGGSVSRDDDGTLCWGARRYIDRSLDTIKRLFGELPHRKNVPLPENCHPETDTSPELDEDGQSRYQSLIGMLQWAVTLGRFDIACAVMTMSRFRAAPRKTHLDLLLHVFGYLRNHPNGSIRFRTGIPDHERDFKPVEREWSKMVYGEPEEELPPNMLPPKGKPVRVSAWFDANLFHDFATGRSAHGYVTMVNQTPITWTSTRQGTVETATYATEFIAGRACCDEVLTIRQELRMLGAPLDGPAWVFGDNKAMIDSSMLPEGRLTKRSVILSFHRVRQAVASKAILFFHIDGKLNIADCLTKHLGRGVLHSLIKPVLFWQGDTIECGRITITHNGETIQLTPITEAAIGEYQVNHSSLMVNLNNGAPSVGVTVVEGCESIEDLTLQSFVLYE